MGKDNGKLYKTMSAKRPFAMSIAGFDPSGGAGVLADVKTFENLKVTGFGVLTANTFQNDVEVKRVEWMPVATVLEQIDVLLERFDVDFFKIGIVKNSEDLMAIKEHIIQKRPKAFIIWDPVLRSSSGFAFFNNTLSVSTLLHHIHLVTPNLPEFDILFQTEEKALELSYTTMIYRKGGHSKEKPGVDDLFRKGKKYVFEPQLTEVTPKHGSGCVLSSALCAFLANGYSIFEACEKSKRYMERFLSSNATLLGWSEPGF
jgi:hydroxymethylpyrimidine/phosphomethylpyrimidine kinase